MPLLLVAITCYKGFGLTGLGVIREVLGECRCEVLGCRGPDRDLISFCLRRERIRHVPWMGNKAVSPALAKFHSLLGPLAHVNWN